MSSRKKQSGFQMPRIYTIEDILKRTGISSAAVCERMKSREYVAGPYQRLRGVYVFSEDQFDKLCADWGRGQNAIREHAKRTASAQSATPRRRRAS